MTKAFVFGLDGATFDLILPWAKEGKLPNFNRLLTQGSWGPLESAPNMRSPAAWTSFMTGKNPGKHGVLEFYEPIAQSYDVRFIKGGMRHGKTLWTILSEKDFRVGVINVPMTYPAEAVNGFLIAGLDAPGPQSPDFCYPPDLSRELEGRFGSYILEPGLTGYLVNGRPDLAVEKLKEELAQKEEITRYLMKTHDWDFFMVVFRSLDAVQHCFWKYMDPLHPQYNPDDARDYGMVILDAYQQIDRILGSIRSELDEDTLFMVMSDHGFGRRHPANHQLNQWLASHGFLTYLVGARQPAFQRLLTRLVALAFKVFVRKTSRSVKERFARWFPRLRDRVQSRLCYANIDWSRTQAYSDTLFPNIRVNLMGREPEGIVKPGEEYAQVIQKLRLALGQCRDDRSGRLIVQGVYHRDELYSGPFVEKAPDLLIRWKEDEAIHGLDLGEGAGTLPPFLEEGAPLVPGEDPNIISGDHRLEGVFMAQGKAIKQGQRLERAHIMDLAPTLLYQMDVPLPTDMDGKVLTEIFETSFLDGHSLTTQDTVTHEEPYAPESGEYTEKERREIEERLRALGYLE